MSRTDISMLEVDRVKVWSHWNVFYVFYAVWEILFKRISWNQIKVDLPWTGMIHHPGCFCLKELVGIHLIWLLEVFFADCLDLLRIPLECQILGSPVTNVDLSKLPCGKLPGSKSRNTGTGNGFGREKFTLETIYSTRFTVIKWMPGILDHETWWFL